MTDIQGTITFIVTRNVRGIQNGEESIEVVTEETYPNDVEFIYALQKKFQSLGETYEWTFKFDPPLTSVKNPLTTPAWHDINGEPEFGFLWKGMFVQQLWTPEHEEHRELMRRGVYDASSPEHRRYMELNAATIFRHKLFGYICAFGRYNYHGAGEFIVIFDDGSTDSMMCREFCPVNGRWPDEQ